LSEESPASVQNHALSTLTALGVDVRFKTRVLDVIILPNGQTEVTPSAGSKLIADLYVPTYGLVPNSSYVPSKFLTSKGSVIVDEYLKANGVEDVWALGDVADVEWKQFASTDKQSSYVSKSIASILSNKTPTPYTVTPASSRKTSQILDLIHF
jgi:NADH dehydrogenase FAD-containing subunit